MVAGGAGRLGSVLCRRLCERGARVVVADVDRERAKALADDLTDAVGTDIDVTSEDSVEAALDIATAHGELRAVVGCAGTGLSMRLLGKDGSPHSTQSFREMLEVHAVGSFLVTARAARRMSLLEPVEGGERGVIINTSSLAGLEGSSGLIAYGTAKAAVAGMTLIAARDLSPVAIRVMAIAPSNIGEPEMDELVAGIPAYARVLEQTPWPKRIGRPEEYAMTVEFILANQYVNGSVIRLDGGVRLPLK